MLRVGAKTMPTTINQQSIDFEAKQRFSAARAVRLTITGCHFIYVGPVNNIDKKTEQRTKKFEILSR